MKRVAVFGNIGGGKSRLSRQISAATNLPLYVLDKIQFKPGGIPISPKAFNIAHKKNLRS